MITATRLLLFLAALADGFVGVVVADHGRYFGLALLAMAVLMLVAAEWGALPPCAYREGGGI